MRIHSHLLSAFLLCQLLIPGPLVAQAPAAEPADAMKKEEEKKPPVPPAEKSSQTKHTITLDGQTVAYTATAGNYLMKDEDGTPKASIFFVAYTRDGVKDPGARPVTFSFNGGPGAAPVQGGSSGGSGTPLPHTARARSVR